MANTHQPLKQFRSNPRGIDDILEKLEIDLMEAVAEEEKEVNSLGEYQEAEWQRADFRVLKERVDRLLEQAGAIREFLAL